MSSGEYVSDSAGSSHHSGASDRLEAEIDRMNTSSSAPEAGTGRGQEASSSSQASGANLAAITRGAWKGSDVKQPEIDWLYRSRRIPAEACERFPRIAAEALQGPIRKRALDKEDPDPHAVGHKHKMGRTHTSCPDLPSASANPPIVEHVSPLEAEVGPEFLEKLASRGQKKKAPASEAGTSDAPPAKRSRKEIVGGKEVTAKRYRKREMPVTSGPALKITKSATGMRPEGSEGAARASPPPQPTTLGLGKDKLPVVDPAGPRSTGQHFGRLRRAVKEFDTAWHDANNNVAGTLDTRKQLFEELLWEHRYLSEAHSKCQAVPEATVKDLTDQLATLKAEKEQLAKEHQQALDAQRTRFSELKDKLMEAEVRHSQELKDAKAAAETKLDDTLKEYAHNSEVLRLELEEQSKARKAAEDRIGILTTDQAEYDRLVMQADALAFKLFPDSQVHAIKKVAERRAEQSMTNPDAPWDPYDHLVALAARICHMRAVDRHLVELPERAIEIFKVLWPGEAVPVNLTLISDRLKDACRRIREWKWSAARAGADAALRIACSWYEELDLDAFHSLLGDAPTDTDPVLSAKRQDRAYRIAEFAHTRTFIPPPPGVRDEISDDEEDAEDEQDEEAAGGNAPPEQGDAPPEAPEAGAQPPLA
ncbi:uncharacterized protein [Lolium perenne]|uniref:uncharacterized protein n=1 Tax=Lolium perenne TaxID=4522 RepID=UPI003A99230D